MQPQTVPVSTPENGNGVLTANSSHPGGVNCAFFDGTVRFIRDSINAGDQNANIDVASGPSPFGVWGAMGSRNALDTVNFD
jgi:prepilin-type processing-associated H-X9-DG protein